MGRSFTCRPVYTWRQRPHYPLNMRLCGPCARFGRSGIQETLLCLPEIEKITSRACDKIYKLSPRYEAL
jgi:hypothetical protein